MPPKTKATAAEVAEEAAPPKRRGTFAVYAAVAEVTGNTSLENLELKPGPNKFRIIDSPYLFRKHWDLPASSELSCVPCRKLITDIEAYLEAAKADQLEAYLDTLGVCEYCELEKEYGFAELGKDKSFYNCKDHWCFNAVQTSMAGTPPEVVYHQKVAEFHQASILNGIRNFEIDPEWTPSMPNGLEDREIIITRAIGANKRITYSIGGSPSSGPLDADTLKLLRKRMIDIPTLKNPPAFDADGDVKWAVLLAKAGEPKDGEKPKVPKG
jgi:hypothetical protein